MSRSCSVNGTDIVRYVLYRGNLASQSIRDTLVRLITETESGSVVDADHLLLLTATPHHGDDDRFGHFVRLIDPDLFPEPTRIGDRAGEIRRDILSLGENCPWALRRLKEDLRDIHGQRLFPDRHAHTVTFRLNQEAIARIDSPREFRCIRTSASSISNVGRLL